MQKNQNKSLRVESSGSRRRGFSLVEVLLTLMILSVGVSAVAVLMTSNIKNSISAKNQVIASELAQEGLELVTRLKSNQDKTATKFTADMPVIGTDYRIDYNSNYGAFKSSNIPDDAQKRLNLSASSLFLHTATTPSKFYRKISVTIAVDADPLELKKNALVTSYVSWNGAGIPIPCNIATKCVAVSALLPDLK